jgi:DNA-binding MarR family transcriptional regulator
MSRPEKWTAAPSTTVDTTGGQDEPALHRFLRCGHVLGSLFREILEEAYLSQRCTHPLTRTQFCLLKMITLSADLHPSEIATYLSVTPAAITKTVNKLEQLGLVERGICPEDRRATLLSPTKEGHRVVEEYEELKSDRMSPVVQSLEPHELDELCDLLEALCVDLVRHGRGVAGQCMRCAGYYSDDCLVGLEQGECALRPRGELRREETV